MKKTYSPHQQEFEPIRKITIDTFPSTVIPSEIGSIMEEKKKQYSQTVARNVEIMGDLIWRYTPSEKLREEVQAGMNDVWLDIMDRMKRIMQLCDVDSPLNYNEVYRLDPIKQKIIQRELETIRGRYRLEEHTNGFVTLENWYVRGVRN